MSIQAIIKTEQQNVWKRKISIKEGGEGPRHDPYHYTIYRLRLNDGIWELRVGSLGYARFSINGTKIVEGHEGSAAHDRAIKLFEMACGFSLKKFQQYDEKLHPWYNDPMGHPSLYV